MRRLLASEILVLAVVAPLSFVMAAGSNDPAEAAGSPCVTRAEHRAIKRDMTKKRVEGIVDFSGVKSAWFKDSWYYRWCRDDGTYTLVKYTPPKPRRVVSKMKLVPTEAA